MLDLNISHKKLIKKYLAQFSYEDIQLFENKGTILYQYYLDMKARPDFKGEPRDALEDVLQDEKNKADDQFVKYIDQISELWIARRFLALQSGKFTLSSGSIASYLKAVKNYHLLQLKLFRLIIKGIKDKLLLFLGRVFLFSRPPGRDLFKKKEYSEQKVT